jgi:hypothetical protein
MPARQYVYDDFSIEFNRLDSCFYLQLSSDQISLNEYHFVFVLFKDKAKVFEVRWVRDQKMFFDDHGDGVYYVQVEYRKIGTKESKFVRTKTISFMTDEYKRLLAAKLDLAFDVSCDLPFMHSEEPFFDFMLINDGNFKLDGFKRLETGVDGQFLYTNAKVDSFTGHLLSGFCITNDNKYVTGYDLLCADASHSNSRTLNSVGTYSRIFRDGNKLDICADYHSSNKLHYYSRDGITLVSNRYHLAMLYLKARKDVPILLNKKKALAMLSTRYHELFSHNFNSESLIHGLFQLYVGQKVVVGSDLLIVENGDLYSVIDDRDLFSINDTIYEELVQQSAIEIKENIKAVLSSDKFSDVVVDVSGGIDSRTVFCGVTNFNEYRDKVSVRIFKSKFEYDHLVANTISNIYGYRFHNARNGWQRFFYNPSQYISYIMEAKYFMPSEAKVVATDTILLNGFYGEPSLRPRGSASFLLGASYEREDLSLDSFLNNMVSFNSSPVMIVDYDKAGYLVKEVYEEEFKRTPGSSLAIKLENHYMNFSHAYHASESLRPGQDVASFSPIKSKTLLKLYRSIFHMFKNRKLAFDLIYKLNSLVSIAEYESESYNEEYKKTKGDLLVFDDPIMQSASIPVNRDVESWKASLKELSANFKNTNRMPPRIEYETCIALLQKISSTAPDLVDPIKFDLLHYIENVKDVYIEINCVKNKLFVLSQHLI